MPESSQGQTILCGLQRRMLQEQIARLRDNEAWAVQAAILRPHDCDDLLKYARDIAAYATELEHELFTDNTLQQHDISSDDSSAT